MSEPACKCGHAYGDHPLSNSGRVCKHSYHQCLCPRYVPTGPRRAPVSGMDDTQRDRAIAIAGRWHVFDGAFTSEERVHVEDCPGCLIEALLPVATDTPSAESLLDADDLAIITDEMCARADEAIRDEADLLGTSLSTATDTPRECRCAPFEPGVPNGPRHNSWCPQHPDNERPSTDTPREPCHICHRPKDQPGGVYCSYPHPLADARDSLIREAIEESLGRVRVQGWTLTKQREALAALDSLMADLADKTASDWRNYDEQVEVEKKLLERAETAERERDEFKGQLSRAMELASETAARGREAERELADARAALKVAVSAALADRNVCPMCLAPYTAEGFSHDDKCPAVLSRVAE